MYHQYSDDIINTKLLLDYLWQMKKELILTNIVPFKYKNKILRTTKFINIIIIWSK